MKHHPMHDRRHGSTTRRRVLGNLACDVADIALPPFARMSIAADSVAATAVAPDLTLLTGAGGNILVLATEAGKVLVDNGAAESARDVLAALDALPDGPVAMLLNTHWHLDQIGGNDMIGRAGAVIVAHEKTRIRLRTGYYLPSEDR